MIRQMYCCEPVLNKIIKLEKVIFFNLIIRSLLAVYINLCITEFLSLFSLGNVTGVNVTMTIFLLTVCIATLIFAILSKPKFLERESV